MRGKDLAKWALHDAPMLLTDKGKPDSTSRFVLVVVAADAHPDGTGSFPSNERIQLATGFDERTVERALGRLAAEGLISKDGEVAGHTQWKVAVELRRPAADKKVLAERKAEQRRKDTLRRQQDRRKAALEKAANATLSGTQNPGQLGPSEAVSGSVSGTQNPGQETPRMRVVRDAESGTSYGLDGVLSGAQNPGIRDAESRTRHLHCLFGRNQEDGGTLPPNPLRPQAPPSSGLGTEYATGAFDGSTVQKLDHEGCVDRAHTRVGTHAREATWTDVRCEHGLTVYSRPDEACCFLGRLGVPADSMRLVPGAS